MATNDVEDLLALEKRRCDAIEAGDAETLMSMLDENYIHIHLNAFEDTREGHIERVLKNPRRLERDEIQVRVLGDVAILNGTGANHLTNPDGTPRLLPLTCQQTLQRRGDGWVYITLQMTPLRALPADSAAAAITAKK